MKKTGFTRRALAMLLILVSVIQLLPVGVLGAFGTLQATDPGVDVSTLKQVDAINWPIKVYDYLSDGMLFEWMDTNTTKTSSDPNLGWGHTDATAYTAPYGGGTKPPTTAMGADFTYAASTNLASSGYNSINYWRNYNNNYYGNAYIIDFVDAKDYQTPYHVHIRDGNYSSRNFMLNYFATDQSTAGNIRYMVMVYRAEKVQNNYFSISCTTGTSGTGWARYDAKLPDSTEWTYKVFDLQELAKNSTKTDVQYIWLSWHTSGGGYGMDSGAYVDLTHVGYFNNRTEAENYGKAAVAFDKDPGEYLAHQVTTTYTYSYVTPATRGANMDHIFSLNYCWQAKDTEPKMFDAYSNTNKVRYGMDFTHHSVEKGWKTNAYTSDTFWTWTNGTTLTLKNTINNITRTESYAMSRIGVEQKTQANGAQYVRLTTSTPSKILLSKFREDHQTVQEGFVPLLADVDYMVLVYRSNGLDAEDHFGLWAQGYLDSSSPDGHKTANNWSTAGLTKESDWTKATNIKHLEFPGTSGWQYRIIPLKATLTEGDPEMEDIDRIANLGLYLPAMSEGESIDIAYVGYYKNNPSASDGMQFDVATTFAQEAVTYMNTAAKITQDVNQSKTLTNNRKWQGGGNKSFGMLYSSGGGLYWPGSNSGGESTSTDKSNYGYEFDTWMIGYRTNAQSENSFNAARYNLVWNANTGKYDKVKYTAKYTPSGTAGKHDTVTFNAAATGTTNYIYFIAATTDDLTWGSNDGDSSNGHDFNTKDMPFDGYQLLETITSGVMTAGLLEGGLQTVVVDGQSYRVPVYRQETVEYIAYNLLHGLRIPMRDSNGSYNTHFIKGTESTMYGGVDLNGDGVIGYINYDGDSRTGTNGNELNEASVDLATALRHELGLTPSMGNSVNVTASSSGVSASYDDISKKMGNYNETLTKSRMLYGEFSQCRNAIDTAMDAAFYLLNNLFISNSYNQEQDDYDYLTLSSAQVNALGHSGFAYVFDAGFTAGQTATAGTSFTDNGTNKSAIKYSPYDTSGNGTGTISMDGVTGKTLFDYGREASSWTTRFPFLPITDAEGDFAGETKSYYFLDDAQRVYTDGSNSYKDRNFNYVIASNGEFVYREADDLFFEFEGDDDVYLFINGQLVLDIGGAHSITSVYIDVNDYVNAAATALSELSQYGYNKDMSIDQFDKWISSATLEYLDSDFNPTGESIANPYYATAKVDEFKRQHRLNLSDGQICQFDFYYMERHGWGANMRIVTNMHITDPALKVEKEAYQHDDEIEYGGVIDPTSAVEYSFTLNNTGNTKLYNLTWKDEVLGITMDPVNGLQVNPEYNDLYVKDASNGPLEAKDLIAIVRGTDASGTYSEFTVTFDEIIDQYGNSDGGQTAFKKFLKKLESDDGTDSGFEDAEVTNAGSGLWVGCSVQIRGMYYRLKPEELKAGKVDNTVYLTATTKVEPTTLGNRTLRSDASHLLYTNGFPIHYQWVGHNIFMNLSHLLDEAKKEATREGSQLSLYQTFFKNVTMDNLYTQPCDKFGKVGGDYSDFLNAHTDESGHTGYLINYDEPGIYVFYLLMYMKNGKDDEGNTKTFASSGVNASDIGDGYYAILRSQVFVVDVEDSVYVLDYGLSTETLDADGSLFENDYLFGSYSTISAKLMGVTKDIPSFIDPVKQKDATMNGISFAAQNLEAAGKKIYTNDGYFNVNLAIPETGKDIAYNSITGDYTLTGKGTRTITVYAPEDNSWGSLYMYYWYDASSTGPSWPGTPMREVTPNVYEVDIPEDVTNVIVNNGIHEDKTKDRQTNDLKLSPYLASQIEVFDNGTSVTTNITTLLEEIKVHVKPGSVTANDGTTSPAWSNVKLHYTTDEGEVVLDVSQLTDENGNLITDASGAPVYVDENGYYCFKIPGNVSSLYLSDGGNNRIVTQNVYSGREIWMDLGNTSISNVVNDETGVTTYFYDVKIRYSTGAGYVVHAMVPDTWKDDIYIYYWHEGLGADDVMKWPGIKMEKGDMWYTTTELVPPEITHIIINDGADGNNHQTENLVVTPGLETWIMVKNETKPNAENNGLVYSGDVFYGSESGAAGLTFTPQKFMDEENSIYLAITVHSTNKKPTGLNEVDENGNKVYINIHNEVQMYKKLTVLPATVVYYEDCFTDIAYNKNAALTNNVFNRHGNGSGLLSQSINQSQPYGQDAAYQSGSNELYSGDSLTAVTLNDTGDVATFTFKGTGFELIGRTNAKDSGSTVAWVYDAAAYAKYAADPANVAKPDALRIVPVVTQFDHGNNGGSEAINQVPVIRSTGMTYGEYTVVISGVPTYVFDAGNNIIDTKETFLYIDGLRIYQPMGATNEHYSAEENGATILELRDQILKGNIAVGNSSNDSLTLSAGLQSWTESLFDNDFDPNNLQTFEGIIVGSADEYLIQGPNNELYMEGNVSGGALAFYVSKTSGDAHNLQIAIRALDYGKFYGAGSTKLAAQLQYGILLDNGNYGWKNLARINSGTEQYYNIPVDECPVDANGRYQIVLRSVEPGTELGAMVAYTNLKLNGYQLENLGNMGDSTILYFDNGIKVAPIYYLNGTINGKTFTTSTDTSEMDDVQFCDGKVSLHLDSAAVITIRRDLAKNISVYAGQSDLGDATSATLYQENQSYGMNVPAGDVTFFLKQSKHASLQLSYCAHAWDQGEITKEPTCCHTGIRTLKCTKGCGETKDVDVEINPVGHSYSGGKCVLCQESEPGFYLIGYINGANYGCENDWQNMGQYKFVDGKVVAKFTQGSYVFVKSENNSDWYMTQVYTEGKSAILYNTNTGSSQKMFVPANVEVTFTLVQNPDGTLSLSYTYPCTHKWGEGVIITPATCTEVGVKLHSCTECGEQRIEAIVPTGHDYVEHVCSICHEEEMITIYFSNTAQWQTVYIWAWDDAGNNYTGGAWPGMVMHPVVDADGLYYYELSAKADNVIFSNGAGTQTADLRIPTNGNNLYTYNGQWGLKADHLDYYLVGFINGADYGAGADADNLGQYKFVDGKLVITFTEDSYVLVKTTGNAYWYMTDVFDKTKESVTLFDSSIGAKERMFAPAGIELTFQLVLNDNGTLTLSYTRPCEHTFDEGQITVAATCSSEGVKTHTCTKCGVTETQVIPATGHTYVNDPDVCDSCGLARTHRIYFRNDSDWSAVYIWAWDSNSNYTGGNWPGMEMSYDADLDLYYFDLSVKATSVLFNNNAAKTGDLTIPTDGKLQFNFGAGEWSAVGELVEPPKKEFCLIGYIEGADSGTGNDWQDTDSYRFAESIVVTFNQDAYVAVKTADNSNWYWLGQYSEANPSTFVKDGGNEKMKIPAGTWLITLVDNGDNSVTIRYEAYTEGVSTASMEMDEQLSNTANMYVSYSDENALNLAGLSQQMNSNAVYGVDFF